MKKFFVIAGALAALVIPSVASADVTRCEAVTASNTVTFTVLQPKDTTGQFTNVWKHDYTVTVDPNGSSFTGIGTITDNGGPVAWRENITGSFNAAKTVVSFDTVPVGGGATFQVTDALMNDTTVPVVTTWTANAVEFRISPATVVATTESVKNHGQYVKAQGGAKDAAQDCAGMPVNSAQGKK